MYIIDIHGSQYQYVYFCNGIVIIHAVPVFAIVFQSVIKQCSYVPLITRDQSCWHKISPL